VKEKKQTLLVRFFRREIVEHILFTKKMLKGSEISLFEDTTIKNRTLIFDLNQRAEVEIAWSQSGKVWAKLYNIDKRIRVLVTENLDTVMAKYPTASLPHNQAKRIHPKNQVPAAESPMGETLNTPTSPNQILTEPAVTSNTPTPAEVEAAKQVASTVHPTATAAQASASPSKEQLTVR
jgi:hypothetical protein